MNIPETLSDRLNTQHLSLKFFSQHKDSLFRDTVSVEIKPVVLPDGSPGMQKTVNIADSAAYYKKVIREPDSVFSHQLVLADSIGLAAGNNLAGIYFNDSLEVSYKWKRTSAGYNILSSENKKEKFLVSQLVFMNKKPVYIQGNGYYYDVYDLKVTGYWAWWETLANKLPYDYYPPAN